jgi:uncharacterized membrane protein
MVLSGRTAATILLALAAVAAPLIPLVPCSGGPGAGAALRAAAYGTGALVCHQRPDRSFVGCGRPWPVCGRCSGLYLGAGTAAWLQLALGRRLRHRGRHRAWRAALALAAAPTAALWLLEVTGLLGVSSIARLIGALPLGLVIGGWLGALARGDLR